MVEFVKSIVTLGVVGCFILIGEYFWRHKKYQTEFTRKFVHIGVASFVAVWPLYLSWRSITGMSICLLIGVIISDNQHIFKGIHSVSRASWGEVLFAVAIGVSSLITTSDWVFAAAMLHLGLADGFAAVIGTRYGKPTQYVIFGHTKSIIGSATFFGISLVVTASFLAITHTLAAWPILLLLPILATFIENATIRGIDNIAVPLVVVLVLQALL